MSRYVGRDVPVSEELYARNFGVNYSFGRRILGKLPADFSANFAEFFGLVSPGFQGPKNSRPNSNPKSSGIKNKFFLGCGGNMKIQREIKKRKKAPI